MKQFNLRLPDDLHEKMKHAAEQDRRSINTWLTILIERSVGPDHPASPPP